MAAVLTVGDNAALSHVSAALLWRIWRGSAALSHVLTPDRRRSQPGLCIHHARELSARDVTRRDGIPVTTVPRTLVDLSDVLDAQRLANVIHEAAFHGRFDLEGTRGAMARAHGRRKLGVLEQALTVHLNGGAGTRSGLEDRFLAAIRAHGLPAPLVNTRIAGIEVDFHWPDRRLCVEIDGPGHERPRTRDQDRGRERRLHAAGQRVLRVTEEDVVAETAIARVRTGLDG